MISYGKYTLDEAEKIIRFRDENERRMRRERTSYYIKQKVCGAVMAAIGVIVPFVCDGDATISIIVVPVGLFLIVTRQKVMTF